MTQRVSYHPHYERAIGADQIRRLYDTAGWWSRRDRSDIEKMLASGPAVGVWHGDQLIGFGRAVSDGVFRAYIEDVIVDPDWRGRGVGSRLILRLMAELTSIEVVSLFCDPEIAALYERLGFQRTSQAVMHHVRCDFRGEE